MLRTVSDMEIVPQRFRMGDEQSPGSLCVGIKVSGRVGLFDTAADSRLMLSWKAAMGNSVSDIRLLVSRSDPHEPNQKPDSPLNRRSVLLRCLRQRAGRQKSPLMSVQQKIIRIQRCTTQQAEQCGAEWTEGHMNSRGTGESEEQKVQARELVDVLHHACHRLVADSKRRRVVRCSGTKFENVHSSTRVARTANK
ncbi:hypothetical protein F2P81_013412 [Scophthalmus maximus]|uniref:Uncharacterized protein n=1 Tax=Scophthalmus maximus TaxID=52904 RepID=A0A6A4SDY8_SCOMX|nr:hypothetical protein F2P81_013412 [Scophthalmus maximus]